MDNGQAAENIALVIAALVAVSLALTQGVGPLVTYLTEAVKATGKIADGWSGIVAIVIGMLLGTGIGAIADAFAAEPYSLRAMLLLGAFSGALMAAGSVKTFKAMATMNTSTAYNDGYNVGEGSALRLSAPMTGRYAVNGQSVNGESPRPAGVSYDDLHRARQSAVIETLEHPDIQEVLAFVRGVKEAHAAEAASELIETQAAVDGLDVLVSELEAERAAEGASGSTGTVVATEDNRR